MLNTQIHVTPCIFKEKILTNDPKGSENVKCAALGYRKHLEQNKNLNDGACFNSGAGSTDENSLKGKQINNHFVHNFKL